MSDHSKKQTTQKNNARIAIGMTQKELAEKMGVKEQQVQRDEANQYSLAGFQHIAAVKVEVPHYWSDRKRALEILRYLSRLEHIHHLPHWKKTLKLRGFWLARWRMIMVNY
jgi:transcriptional regulator with XRE-family HTH domain